MGVEFHFLNVGAGDCTIVHFPERTRNSDGYTKAERIMMVDINHHGDGDEYEDVISYYKAHFREPDGSLKPIFRFICTHPHQDHICGLHRLLNDREIKVLNFWDLEHEFEPENTDEHPTHEEDWRTYTRTRQSQDSPRVIRTCREDEPRQYWCDSEDRITVLSCQGSPKTGHHGSLQTRPL